MIKAYVNGVECTIYGYHNSEAGIIADVLYPNINRTLPVLASLIEIREEEN